ncbi:hypothetical protein [Bacillus tuaregi]|uniref:hypothetical protein n=1 Tax=Bacillus tuaregi TaxID=1816695 RepID=UPI0008F95376|nr:hypothetical protein [Bacillus tuaregi]
MHCSHCGHSQTSGKFCVKCGNSFVRFNDVENDLPASEMTVSIQPNVAADKSMNKAKTASSQYFHYFFSYLKNPTKSFENNSVSLMNGIVTWLIVTLMIGFIVYTGIKHFVEFYADSLSDIIQTSYFMPVFSRAWGISIATTGLIILILYGLIHLFIRPRSLKWVASMYGSVLLPVVILSLLTWLLIMMRSYTSALIVFTFTLSMMTIVLPLIVLFQASNGIKTKMDRTYLGFIYIVTYTIATYILYYIVLESTFTTLLKYYTDFVRYFW